MPDGEAGERVPKIAQRIDIVEHARLDQRGDAGPMVGPAVGTGEPCVKASERMERSTT